MGPLRDWKELSERTQQALARESCRWAAATQSEFPVEIEVNEHCFVVDHPEDRRYTAKAEDGTVFSFRFRR